VTVWPTARYWASELAAAKFQVTVPLLAAVTPVPSPAIVKALSRAVARAGLMAPELIDLLTTDLVTRAVSEVSTSVKVREPEATRLSAVRSASSVRVAATTPGVTVGASLAPAMVMVTFWDWAAVPVPESSVTVTR
jgi:hypothetical protein